MSSEQKTTLLGLLKLAQTTLAKIESELADSRNRETAFYRHLSNNKEEIEVAAQALSKTHCRAIFIRRNRCGSHR